MSKAKQNTFLTGYFAILAVGTVGLGYLAWSSISASSEAKETYDTKRNRLATLQKAAIFPKAENVTAKKAQVDAFAAKVGELNDKLRAFETPLDAAMTTSAFQNKLQLTRDALAVEAKDSGVKLPENFDLGMGTYLGSFPDTTAVPRLNAWLDGLGNFFHILISNGVKEITTVTRPELPFEKGQPDPKPVDDKKKAPAKPAATAKTKQSKDSGPPPPALPESAVLDRYPFHVTFTVSAQVLNRILTDLSNPGKNAKAPSFYNIRVLRIENEQMRGAETSKPVQVREETDEASQKPYKRDSEFIFGDEQLQVHLGVDLIRFPAASEPAAPVKAASTTK
jgi:hypothetical protein